MEQRCRVGSLGPIPDLGAQRPSPLLTNGFTISRAQSMNSCTTGVSVRFFNVMIPVGHGETGKSTGRILRRGRFAPKCTTETINVLKIFFFKQKTAYEITR